MKICPGCHKIHIVPPIDCECGVDISGEPDLVGVVHRSELDLAIDSLARRHAAVLRELDLVRERRADALRIVEEKREEVQRLSKEIKKATDVTEARSHLGAALSQIIDTDNRIIVDHIRAAYLLLGGVL